MADRRFSFQVDPSGGLVRARLIGLLNAQDVQDYFVEQKKAVVDAGGTFAHHSLLLDIRDWSVQTQDVVAAFQRQLGSGGTLALRSAIVCGSALIRLQLQRILKGRADARVFDALEPAEAWLMSD